MQLLKIYKVVRSGQGRYALMIRVLCVMETIFSSPYSAHGNMWIRRYIPPTDPSWLVPLPLALSWPELISPGSIQCRTLGGCVIKPRPKYLSLLEASGCSSWAAWLGWLGGGQSHGHLGRYKFWGLALVGGADGAAAVAVSCGASFWHGKEGGWSRCAMFWTWPPSDSWDSKPTKSAPHPIP